MKTFEENELINIGKTFSDLEIEIDAPLSDLELTHIDNERKAFTETISYQQVVEDLFAQLRARRGKWIGDRVAETAKELSIPLSVLDRIIEEYPHLNKRGLRKMLSQPRYRNQIKDGYINIQKEAV